MPIMIINVPMLSINLDNQIIILMNISDTTENLDMGNQRHFLIHQCWITVWKSNLIKPSFTTQSLKKDLTHIW